MGTAASSNSNKEELLLRKLQDGVISQEEYNHISTLVRFESEHAAALDARQSLDGKLDAGTIDALEHKQMLQRLTVGAEMNEQALLRSLFDLGGRGVPRRMSDLGDDERARYQRSSGGADDEGTGEDDSSMFESQFDDETEDTAFVLAGSDESDDEGYAADETVVPLGSISAALREAGAPEMGTAPSTVALGVVLSSLDLEPSALVRELVRHGGGQRGVGAIRRHEFVHSALAAISSNAPPSERINAGRSVAAFADELWQVDTAMRKRHRAKKLHSLVFAEVYADEKAARAAEAQQWGGTVEHGSWTYCNNSGATLGVRTTPDYPGVKMDLGIVPGHVFTVHKRVRKVVKCPPESSVPQREVTFLLLDHVREVMEVSVIAYKARLKAEEARRRVKLKKKRNRWGILKKKKKKKTTTTRRERMVLHCTNVRI